MKKVRFIALCLTIFLANTQVARSEPVLILAGILFAQKVSEGNGKDQADKTQPMNWTATLTEDENRNIERISKDPVMQACLKQASTHNNPVAQYHLRKIADLSFKLKSKASNSGDITGLNNDNDNDKRPVEGFIWCKREAGIVVDNNIEPYKYQEYVTQIAQLGTLPAKNIRVVMVAEEKTSGNY